jgi:protein-tyrosine phosphatase
MVDIHSHVLYGVDDGARTLEESVAMVQIAAANGTTDLVLTPHANLEYRFEPGVIEERLAAIAAASGDVLQLYSGCDFHLSHENITDALAHPTKYTIDHKCYLLVEFSDLLIFNNTLDIFARLLDAGMIPVVTHPERNGLLRQRIDQIAAWVEAGSRVQITGQSLLGTFGGRAREFCEALLDRGLAHFVASDAHDCEHRPPRLNEAYAWLTKKYGEPLAEALFVTNPRAALDGDPLDLTPNAPVAEPRKWYQIWR